MTFNHGQAAWLTGAFSRAACALLLTAGPALAAQPDAAAGKRWVATWATAIQGAYVAPTTAQTAGAPAYNPQPDLSFALPNATADGARDQTMRMIVKPDIWGGTVRVRFSNAFGTKPVTFGAASVALQEYQADLTPATSVPLSFGGKGSLTVQPGQQVFSDAVTLPFVMQKTIPLLRGRNLAVSFAVTGASGPASYHDAAFATGYISAPGTGDRTGAADDYDFPFSTTSFFFINEVDVMAPKDTLVICAYGDSITDGTFSTLNGDDRWMNAMSRRLHDAYGDGVSVVNAGIAGNAVSATVAGPPATKRLDRDVLSLSNLGLVVWLEGINDLGSAGSKPGPVIAGYLEVAAHLHAAGVKVIGATVTSSLVPGGVVPANSPLGAASAALAANYGSAQTDAYRRQLNAFILGSGTFDATADFAAVTTDATGVLAAPVVPNSEGSAGDYLHPNRAGYQSMGAAAALAVTDLEGGSIVFR